MILIPLNNDPSQVFDIVLEDIVWTFSVYYNSRGEYWSMDLLKNGADAVAGIKLVSSIDLLHALMIMDGDLVIISEPDIDPKIDDFGVTSDMWYLTRAELIDAGL